MGTSELLTFKCNFSAVYYKIEYFICFKDDNDDCVLDENDLDVISAARQ